jgi:hypothetical protein
MKFIPKALDIEPGWKPAWGTCMLISSGSEEGLRLLYGLGVSYTLVEGRLLVAVTASRQWMYMGLSWHDAGLAGCVLMVGLFSENQAAWCELAVVRIILQPAAWDAWPYARVFRDVCGAICAGAYGWSGNRELELFDEMD